MAWRKRRNSEHQYRYDVSVIDWHVNVSFNDYAYINVPDQKEFEESFYMVLEGRVISTTSKKCKRHMLAEVVIDPGDFWYNKHMLKKDVHTIGYMEIQRPSSYVCNEVKLYLRVSVPTKSYENIKDFMTYKGKALVSIIGTELHWRKGEIYALDFRKLSAEF